MQEDDDEKERKQKERNIYVKQNWLQIKHDFTTWYPKRKEKKPQIS